MSPRVRTQDSNLERIRSLLERILPEPRELAVRLPDGSELPASTSAPAATLVLRDPDALLRALSPPIDLSAGEAFVRGEIDVEGELEAVFRALEGDRTEGSWLDRLKLAQDAAALRSAAGGSATGLAARLRGRRHSKQRDRAAIEHHYDLPVAFYRTFLDPRLVYSCGYYPSGEETLAQAQEAKLDLVCRKLRLREGHRLLDIGCGWGSLVQWAAERYGTHGLGVTLAEGQVREGRERLRDAGVAERARVEVRDYRDVAGRFDRIASIGMAEHVGDANLETYFREAYRRLEPGGSMLNHAISRGPLAEEKDDAVSGEFIQRYVFPDGELVSIWRSLQAAERVGFEVRDVEDLREHYAHTLRDWVANLQAHWDEAVAHVGEQRARVWRLFMSASAHQFARGRLSIHQALLAKPDDAGHVDVPASRADLYRG